MSKKCRSYVSIRFKNGAILVRKALKEKYEEISYVEAIENFLQQGIDGKILTRALNGQQLPACYAEIIADKLGYKTSQLFRHPISGK